MQATAPTVPLRLQLRMVALLIATVLKLRRRDTTETLRALADRSANWAPFDEAAGLRAVRRAARLVPVANCLAQSVALTVALTRAGKSPKMILGCRRYDSGKWGAHAWVIDGTEVLDPRPSGQHAAIAELGAVSRWAPVPLSGTSDTALGSK